MTTIYLYILVSNSIRIICGRGSQEEVDRFSSNLAQERIVGQGWDRSYLRGLFLIGGGVFVAMENFGRPEDPEYNPGAYMIPGAAIMSLDHSFIETIFQVFDILGLIREHCKSYHIIYLVYGKQNL